MGIIKNFIKAALGVDKKEASSPRAGSPEPSPGIDLAKNFFPARSRDSHTESDLGITMGSPLAKARDAVDDIVVTDEFRYILEKIKHTKENLFITGRAGTGKSTLLKLLRLTGPKNLAVVAPTGAAAINAGGSTIHSLFHFPPRALAPDDEAIKIDNRRQKMFKTMETLVIDEISMVSADIMDAMDGFLRLNRGKDEPFGGVQVVMFGDPFQLPPVIKGKQLRDYFQNTYGGPYFFNARSFEEGRFSCLELSRVFRQKDEDFLRLLNAAREMTFTARDLRILNSRQRPEQAGDLSVSLCSTNALAQEINERELARLPGKAFEYEAIITGAFKPGDAPTDPLLVLKEGAQVMMVKNDPDKRWINGTLGVIRKLDDNGVTAAIDGMDYDIPRETWEIVDYEYDRDKNKISPKVAGRFTQYPLKLAWAITIHKSQGQTFDRVRVNLGSGAFAHGQTYVALSRCRTLEGLTLEKPVRASDIRIDPLVLEFASRVKSVIPKRG